MFKKELISEYSKQQEFIDNYWMGIGDTTKIITKNPFDNMSIHDIDNPHIFILSLMSEPKYFSFTCKHLLNINLPPYQLAILNELWVRPFPMLLGTRGLGKSFLLGLLCILKASFIQGVKIAIVGGGFRQAKVVFDYAQSIWDNAPVLRSVFGNDRKNGPKKEVDKWGLRIGESLIMAFPLGNTGDKIRGQRANIVIGDEFASIPVEIFETVVRGFGVVSNDPVEKIQKESRIQALKELGLWKPNKEDLKDGSFDNQIIISGTSYYTFNHFYKYWKRYKSIIESCGDFNKLKEIVQNEEEAKELNWQNYSIIRIPIGKLPKGYMNKNIVNQAKATMDFTTYNMEYETIFPSDSNGFFKRSLIENCVVGNPENPIVFDCGEVVFSAAIKGVEGRKYVMGVDPASEADNFSITIIECWPDHKRIVNCWTTTKNKFMKRLQKGVTEEKEFYGFVARKIREFMSKFNIERIGIDSQGGGVAVVEALRATKKTGEISILPIIDEQKSKDTDDMPGLHIIELVNFAKSQWVSDANHFLRKDFENKILLFPQFDVIEIGLSYEADIASKRIVIDETNESIDVLYDTLENTSIEIEELKDELASIIHTQTSTSMRDRWDVPNVKSAGMKKGRLRKDRYSSLLICNMMATKIEKNSIQNISESISTSSGGWANDIKKYTFNDSKLWIAPNWFSNAAGGVIVNRK